MKNYTFIIFLVFFYQLSAQEPSINFTLKNSINKTFYISDIEKIILHTNQNSILKINKKDGSFSKYFTSEITKIFFDYDKSENLTLNFNFTDSSSIILLTEINDLMFIEQPEIKEVSKTIFLYSDTLAISGIHFSEYSSSSSVNFNSIKAKKYISWSDSLITLIIPDGIKNGSITIVTEDFISNSIDYELLPHIEKILPDSFRINDIVSIEGYGFKSDTSNNYILINDLKTNLTTTWTDSLIKFQVPKGSISGNIKLTIGDYVSNNKKVEIIPFISDISSDSSYSDSVITIIGSGFGSESKKCSIVLTDKKVENFINFNDTLITFKIPKELNTGDYSLFVLTSNHKSNVISFSINPFISKIFPTDIILGDTVCIYGNNFGKKNSPDFVFINSSSYLDYSWSDTLIKIVVTPDCNSGKIYIKSHMNCSNAMDLNVDKNAVRIGTQVWMTRNLDVSKYNNGDPIPEVKDSAKWVLQTKGGWCYYNNSSVYGNTYGKIYNWYALTDPRGIIPKGWHLPDTTEIRTLVNFLGGYSIAGGKLKEEGTSHWNSPNLGATNITYFNALPGGYRVQLNNKFIREGTMGVFWTSTLYKKTYVQDAVAWWFLLVHTDKFLGLGFSTENDGLYVRCIRDK